MQSFGALSYREDFVWRVVKHHESSFMYSIYCHCCVSCIVSHSPCISLVNLFVSGYRTIVILFIYFYFLYNLRILFSYLVTSLLLLFFSLCHHVPILGDLLCGSTLHAICQRLLRDSQLGSASPRCGPAVGATHHGAPVDVCPADLRRWWLAMVGWVGLSLVVWFLTTGIMG